MSGSQVPVKPGPAQRLSGATWKGSTVKNLDTVNAVWIGSGGSIKPNINSIMLGPLASTTWTKDTPPWGCVDTGVLTAVTLNVSDDVDTITDPVATGAAVAAKIVASGVPSVAKIDFLGTVSGGIAKTFDVTGYASVTLEASGVTTPMNINQLMDAADIASSLDQRTWTGGGPTYATVQYDIYGTALVITPNDGTTTVKVWGSNRAIVAPGDAVSEIILSGSAAGVAVGANVIAMPAGWNGVGNPGKFTMHFATSAAVTTGYFSVHDNFGNVMVLCETQEMIVGSSSSGKVALKTGIALPSKATIWYNVTGAAGGTVAVAMVAE